jgi:isopenicillin N synthase-like dioxygenase
MPGVPVIDLSAACAGDRAARLRVAREIDAACCDIGFFTIAGHGVPGDVVRALREAAHAFFALPLAERERARHPEAGTPRGYHAIAGEALAHANEQAAPPDLKEFYHVGPVDVTGDPYFTNERGRQFFLPNVWPASPARFREVASVYYRTMDRLVAFLMRLAALALGVEETFFDDKVTRSIGTMRLNYYPRQDVPPLPGQLRAGAHTDYGSLTVLNGEDVPGGLQVRTRQGDWIDVHTPPERFVINIGDLMMRWTNDRWLSNMHRVANPPLRAGLNRPRLSIAFFNHPNYDVLIECITRGALAKHAPVLSGDYRDAKYLKTGLKTTTAT